MTRATASTSSAVPAAYWSLPPSELTAQLQTSAASGLSGTDARRRLAHGANSRLRAGAAVSRVDVLLRQLRSPLLLLLVFAAAASLLTGEWIDATIVIVIVLSSAAIGYSREFSAQTAAAALRARLHTRSRVVRDGREELVAAEDVVPGDVVLLSAGQLVPGDAIVLESTDCFVNDAVLTGESFPVRKMPGTVNREAPLRARSNTVFFGTHVRSGDARCVIVACGQDTEVGAVARRLARNPPPTEFDHGVTRFGYLLTSVMLLLVMCVFVVHTLLGRPAVETLLFAIALAVGLSPELLPAILNVNLARGAQAMARHGVLVRHLNAIENLGSMDVLCTDKTGTITTGVIRLEGAYDAGGRPDAGVLTLAARNAALATGTGSALDDAITAACQSPLTDVRKRGEVPFDFVRKRVTVAMTVGKRDELVTKGAFRNVLDICTSTAGGTALDDGARLALQGRYETWGRQGIRVLAVATRSATGPGYCSRDDEHGMQFAGFLTFLDQPKEDVPATMAALGRLGVSVKVITGDSALVAAHVATLVGLRADNVMTGRDLDRLNDDALRHVVQHADVFAEVEPAHKERIVLTLQKTGHVVGFLGDGVNDAAAMHVADTSLSVDQAVDVAREAADFVLMERDLDVIRRGIEEGRRTFANTLKYILTTTSANAGNMMSMAVASLFLPFLPLTAGQILLSNFLSDIPAVGIADDAVDPEMTEAPQRWNMRFIGRFMLQFGLLSSAFDLATFGWLVWVVRAVPATFRTGWFVESLLTELLVAIVVRTRRPAWRSRPGRLLLVSTAVLLPATLALPYLPVAGVFGFVPLSPSLLTVIVLITLLYVLAAERLKMRVYVPAEATQRRAG